MDHTDDSHECGREDMLPEASGSELAFPGGVKMSCKDDLTGRIIGIDQIQALRCFIIYPVEFASGIPIIDPVSYEHGKLFE